MARTEDGTEDLFWHVADTSTILLRVPGSCLLIGVHRLSLVRANTASTVSPLLHVHLFIQYFLYQEKAAEPGCVSRSLQACAV